MKNNLGEKEQLMRYMVGGLLLGYALSKSKTFTFLGVVACLSAFNKYCPIKELLEDLKIKNFNRAEVNNLPLDDNDDTGGYRIGAAAEGTVTQSAIIP